MFCLHGRYIAVLSRGLFSYKNKENDELYTTHTYRCEGDDLQTLRLEPTLTRRACQIVHIKSIV